MGAGRHEINRTGGGWRCGSGAGAQKPCHRRSSVTTISSACRVLSNPCLMQWGAVKLFNLLGLADGLGGITQLSELALSPEAVDPAHIVAGSPAFSSLELGS